MMENKMIFIEPLLERAEEYRKTSYELFKLKSLDKTVEIVSTFVSRGSVILVLAMFVLVLNIGIALWLGDLLGKTYYGFFCVAGFYGILGCILYFFLHNQIKKYVSSLIISQILN